MTKEKFEAQVVQMGGFYTQGEKALIKANSCLERIKAMCQGAEFDFQEAEMRSKDKPELAAYYRGRATAFNSVLSLIRELE